MKRNVFIILLLTWISYTSFSQSCLPNGIKFVNQQTIDNFSINFPDCIEIEGDVEIYGNNITNLNGLNHLEKIGGSLNIGLPYGTMTLTNLSGLENLKSIGKSLNISHNEALVSLSGLNELISVGGSLYINANQKLTSLTDLNNLSSIKGELFIRFCPSLNNLEGLDHIDPESITSLTIESNASLSSCKIESLCTYLASPNSSIIIRNNAEGCNNPPEIADACDINLNCLPYGHYFLYTQEDVNRFQEDYANCNIIYGNLTIMGDDIRDLSGLSNLTEIKGNLDIGDIEICTNPLLQSLEGLHNIKSVRGYITIDANEALLDLNGLRNLNSVGKGLIIVSNKKIINLDGLNQIKFNGGDLVIVSNPMLSGLSGLENISIIPNTLNISDNGLLKDLSDLKNLRVVSGDLIIKHNDKLTDISGLENITPQFIERLIIRGNSLLSDCHIRSVCAFLADTLAVEYIYDNLEGCNSPEEVIAACENSFSSCLPDGINLNSQSEIEAFQNMYPNCSWLEGDVIISGSDISDLSFLNKLTSIGGDLKIYDNPVLESLNGLDNLVSVGGDLHIGSSSKSGHPLLNDLSGLSALIFVDGDLLIENNQALNNLSGLEHIQPEFLNNLSIRNNPELSECSLENICYYLSNAVGDINISNNQTGCNDQTEVTNKCVLGLTGQISSDIFTIFPNPAKNELTISGRNNIELLEVNIYDQMGQKVWHGDKPSGRIDISGLTQGLYIIEVISDEIKDRQKIIISL